MSVGFGFLSENDKLESLDLSKTIISIFPDNSFSGCSVLSVISLPQHNISFGMRCFSDTSIESLTLSPNIVSLGKECFFRCTHLTIVSMSDSTIEKIPEGCFRDCSMLSEFLFPQHYIDIPAHCFEHTAFTEIIFKPTIRSIDESSFSRCLKLVTVSFLYTNMSEIPKYAFSDCQELKYVYLPASIKKIDYCAFEKCPLSLICYFGKERTCPKGFRGQ